MNTKLTIKINRKVSQRAKRYVKERKTSLSKMIENYLDNVSSQRKERMKISPLVQSLSGVIKLHPKTDYRAGYAKYLVDKYK